MGAHAGQTTAGDFFRLLPRRSVAVFLLAVFDVARGHGAQVDDQTVLLVRVA